VKISADAALVPGSAIFDTARGEVDASIQTQLDEIHRGLADLVRREGAR
jgi:flagellar biosynthesis/type III secretory pathway protein FliH